MTLRQSLLSLHSVSLQQTAPTWQDAVKIGTDLLIKAGVVSEEYYPAILRSVKEHGPYFVLAPGLAMPHARPEEGALATGFALVTLSTPVNIGDPDNDPIDILITLAAKNAQEQTEEAMVEVADLFDDDQSIEAIRKAQTFEDIEKILKTHK